MIIERFWRYQDFYQLAGDELRPDATARVTIAVRADQKFAPRNSMLNADTGFPVFAMKIKEDQCSYTNHQNDVTNYNMVKQQKFKISNYTTKFLTSIIHYRSLKLLHHGGEQLKLLIFVGDWPIETVPVSASDDRMSKWD